MRETQNESNDYMFSNNIKGLDVLKEYHKESSTYLPMTDRIDLIYPKRDEKYGDINLGWNAGLLEKDRPFFVECYYADGVTMLTITVSSDGIEDKSAKEMDEWFQRIGYYRATQGFRAPVVLPLVQNGNKFFSINVLVSDDEHSVINGAMIYPFGKLNAYNSLRMENPMIAINNDDIGRGLFKDVWFFAFSEGGAMGEGGSITFINNNAQSFKGNYVYGDIDINSVMDSFPVLKECKFGIGGYGTTVPKGWNYVNLGFGNHLIVNNSIYFKFKKNFGDKSYGEAYNGWYTVAMKAFCE